MYAANDDDEANTPLPVLSNTYCGIPMHIMVVMTEITVSILVVQVPKTTSKKLYGLHYKMKINKNLVSK